MNGRTQTDKQTVNKIKLFQFVKCNLSLCPNILQWPWISRQPQRICWAAHQTLLFYQNEFRSISWQNWLLTFWLRSIQEALTLNELGLGYKMSKNLRPRRNFQISMPMKVNSLVRVAWLDKLRRFDPKAAHQMLSVQPTSNYNF